MRATYLIYTLLIFIAFKAVDSKASDSLKHWSVGIQPSIKFLQLKEQYASPLVYSGFSAPYGLTGSFSKNQWSTSIYLGAISSTTKNAFEFRTLQGTKLTEWHEFQFSGDILYDISDQKSGLHHLLGGGLSGDYFYTSYEFITGESWVGKANLFLSYQFQFDLAEKQRISFDFQVPVFAYIHRPQYTKDEQFYNDWLTGEGILKYGKFKLVSPEYHEFTTYLGYHCRVSENWQLSILFKYNYYQIRFPLPIRNSRSSLFINIAYLF